MKILLSIAMLFLLNITVTNAQNEKNHWFFGQNAYIDFSNPSTPTVGTGNLNTMEGCATVSDSSGALLFYTDGITVYDNTGAIMPNGTGLKGDPSSTHSALVVPNPCDQNIYYIFTTASVGQDGMYHYTVDLSMGANGDVVAGSETLLLIDATEKIASVKHANGIDFWVTTTRETSGFVEIYSWLVDQNGVSTLANIFTSTHPTLTNPGGTNGATGNYPGQMKFNNNGTILVAAQLYYDREIDFFSFDTTTGFATSFITSQRYADGDGYYGVEFSPNGNFLYTTGYFTNRLWQYDVSGLPGSPTLAAPAYLGNVLGIQGGALQLSPDGLQIYAAQFNANAISSISNINTVGATLNLNSLPLTPGTQSKLGLPTFVSGIQTFNSYCLNQDPYTNAVPTLFPNSVKNEIASSFPTKDKEYGDIDNDGDIDMLYTKLHPVLNIPEIYSLINTAGPGVLPNYTVPGNLLVPNDFSAFSYRLYDWNSDGFNDMIILGIDPAGIAGVWLFINNGLGAFPASGIELIDGYNDFKFNSESLIAVGDLNNDNLPDLVISSQSGEIYGTAYFENNGTNTYPYFDLVAPQIYTPGDPGITGVFIPENNGSYPSPEIYDADCDGDMDLFISDPLLPSPTFGGARVYYHENNGGATTASFPDVNSTGVLNQYGLDDDPGVFNLSCNWIITRVVDYLSTGCPMVISFNPCTNEFFYYDQDCSCEATLAVNELDTHVNQASITLYPNPARDTFSIASEMELHIDLVSIYNLQGKLIQTHSNVNSEMNISEIKTGLYIVQIETGGKTISKKLIKK